MGKIQSVFMNALLLACLALLLDNGRTAVMARPASYDEYLAVEGDLATVGSLRREVRQPAPLRVATEVSDLLSVGNAPTKSHDTKKHKNASGKSDEGGLYKKYGSDAEGEKGYLKKTFSKGDHGYKSLDTFHKTIGDKYGFEEHEAFGKESGEDKAKHQGHAKSASSKHKDSGDHEGAGTDVETQYAEDDGEGEGEYYGGDEGGNYSEGGDNSSYNDGGAEGYSESYGSGDGEGYSSSGETYAADGGSGEGESYY